MLSMRGRKPGSMIELLRTLIGFRNGTPPSHWTKVAHIRSRVSDGRSTLGIEILSRRLPRHRSRVFVWRPRRNVMLLKVLRRWPSWDWS